MIEAYNRGARVEILVKTKNEWKWQKVILTNYHVLHPAIEGFQLVPGTEEEDTSVMGEPIEGSDL